MGAAPVPSGPKTPMKKSMLASTSVKKTPTVSSRPSLADDEFGDFNQDGGEAFEDVDFGDFSAPKTNGSAPNSLSMKPMANNLLDFDDVPLPSRPAGGTTAKRTTGFFALSPSSPKVAGGSFSFPLTVSSGPGPYYNAFQKHHQRLVPLCRHLRSSPSPSSTLALLFPSTTPTTLSEQADLLLTLLLFLSPALQPLHDWGFLRQALLAAADRFDSTCLVAFETAEGNKDEAGMRTAADSSWKVWDAGGGSRDQWECGRVWVEKREVFYETGRWDSLENIVYAARSVCMPTDKRSKVLEHGVTVRRLDFTPMDAFIAHVLETFRIDAELAHRVFPPEARVILSFADRVSSDVMGEYIQPLLSQARVVSLDLFLQASAATFVQAWKLVDVAMDILGTEQKTTPKTKVEDVM